MFGLIRRSKMPTFLKIILNIIVAITVVCWLVVLIYKILDLLRFCIHFATEKGTWWITLAISLIASVICLLLAQYVWNLNPFGYFYDWLNDIINNIRNRIGMWFMV